MTRQKNKNSRGNTKMERKHYEYECPHCQGLDTLLINNWKIDPATGQTDHSNGYVCIKCKNKVETLVRGRKHLRIEPKARKVEVRC